MGVPSAGLLMATLGGEPRCRGFRGGLGGRKMLRVWLSRVVALRYRRA